MEQESRWDSTGSLVLGVFFSKRVEKISRFKPPLPPPDTLDLYHGHHHLLVGWCLPHSLLESVFWGKDVQNRNEATDKVESVLGTKGIKESWSFACTTLLGRRLHNST